MEVKIKMKNFKKAILRITLLCCLAGALLAATYGMIFITSNSVHVDVQYSTDLSHSVVDSEVILDAIVSNNGNPVGAGYNVDFYYSVDSGVNWIYFDSQITDDSGVVQSIYVLTYNGGYDFKAIVTIP